MKNELVKLTQQLIRIDSQNPPGNEKEIALFIQAYLKRRKLPVQLYEFHKDRVNVVCRIPSRRGKKALLITPHTDTVPASGPGWIVEPFSGKIVNHRIYGRGATDCKCNVAVALQVIHELYKKKIRLANLDLLFAFAADEESGSQWGIKPLLSHLPASTYGVVLDSNEFDIVIAQKGLLHLRVDAFGKQAHGAFPQRGINAVQQAVNAVHEILHLCLSRQRHPLLQGPTLSVGRFCGGEKVNIVPGHAFFELDIRYLPAMDKDVVLRRIEGVIKKHIAKHTLTVLAHQEPMEIDKNSFQMRTLQTILKKHKIRSRLRASFGATVINFLQDKGIDTIAFGFGSRRCAHVVNEYVAIDNLLKGVHVLHDYITTLDGIN